MSETSSERTEQRRKLLKKAAAVPAIFVLPSTGRAVAGTSAHVCVARGLDGVDVDSIPKFLDPNGLTPTDQWVREYKPANPNVFPDGTPEGNYLVYDNTGILPRPVAHASCWNSINPKGRQADPNTNLLIS